MSQIVIKCCNPNGYGTQFYSEDKNTSIVTFLNKIEIDPELNLQSGEKKSLMCFDKYDYQIYISYTAATTLDEITSNLKTTFFYFNQ